MQVDEEHVGRMCLDWSFNKGKLETKGFQETALRPEILSLYFSGGFLMNGERPAKILIRHAEEPKESDS